MNCLVSFLRKPWWLALLIIALIPSDSLGASDTCFATSNYWHGFIEHWKSAIAKRNGVVMLVLALGLVALIIITRGKKIK